MDESNSTQTIDSLFKRAIEIERKASVIYLEFANMFSHIPEITTFWIDLHGDELQHMQALTNIHNTLQQEQLSSISDEKILNSLRKAENELNKDLISPIKNLDDAYELAHDLENSEINGIFKFLTNSFIPFEEHSDFVIANIQHHQQKLIDFNHTMGDRAWRKQICTS